MAGLSRFSTCCCSFLAVLALLSFFYCVCVAVHGNGCGRGVSHMLACAVCQHACRGGSVLHVVPGHLMPAVCVRAPTVAVVYPA